MAVREGRASSRPSEEPGKATALPKVEPEDLVRFGLIPEFTGRIPVICTLDELTEDDMVRILTEPKNSLAKQYRELFRMDGAELEFTPEAMKAVAALAIERNTGARGLRSILEETMTDIMFALPSRKNVAKVVVTEDCVRNHAEPEYVLK